jgi:hypothetical protein
MTEMLARTSDLNLFFAGLSHPQSLSSLSDTLLPHPSRSQKQQKQDERKQYIITGTECEMTLVESQLMAR